MRWTLGGEENNTNRRLDEVTKHFQWQQAERQHKKRQVELRIARPAWLNCPRCHVLSPSPASLASVRQPERLWQQWPQKERDRRSATRHRRGDARGAEISVEQDEGNEREKWRTECGIEHLQGGCFIAKLEFYSSNKHGSRILAVWIYSFALLAPATCMLTAYGLHINTKYYSRYWSFYFFLFIWDYLNIHHVFGLCLCMRILSWHVSDLCLLRFLGNLRRRATKTRRLKCHVTDWFIDWAVTFYLTTQGLKCHMLTHPQGTRAIRAWTCCLLPHSSNDWELLFGTRIWHFVVFISSVKDVLRWSLFGAVTCEVAGWSTGGVTHGHPCPRTPNLMISNGHQAHNSITHTAL